MKIYLSNSILIGILGETLREMPRRVPVRMSIDFLHYALQHFFPNGTPPDFLHRSFTVSLSLLHDIKCAFFTPFKNDMLFVKTV